MLRGAQRIGREHDPSRIQHALRRRDRRIRRIQHDGARIVERQIRHRPRPIDAAMHVSRHARVVCRHDGRIAVGADRPEDASARRHRSRRDAAGQMAVAQRCDRGTGLPGRPAKPRRSAPHRRRCAAATRPAAPRSRHAVKASVAMTTLPANGAGRGGTAQHLRRHRGIEHAEPRAAEAFRHQQARAGRAQSGCPTVPHRSRCRFRHGGAALRSAIGPPAGRAANPRTDAAPR